MMQSTPSTAEVRVSGWVTSAATKDNLPSAAAALPSGNPVRTRSFFLAERPMALTLIPPAIRCLAIALPMKPVAPDTRITLCASSLHLIIAPHHYTSSWHLVITPHHGTSSLPAPRHCWRLGGLAVLAGQQDSRTALFFIIFSVASDSKHGAGRAPGRMRAGRPGRPQ